LRRPDNFNRKGISAMQMRSFKSIGTGIVFVSASLASSAVAAPAGLPDASQEAQDIGVCAAPTSWARTDKVLTCTCPANFNISTSLWGTDIYTADSYICTTALHASVLDRSGGRVTIEMLPGQNSYAGTKRNGVSTRSYGKYTASYRFVNPSTTGSSQTAASPRGKKTGSRNPFEKGAAAILNGIGLGGLGQATDQQAGENIGQCTGATKWRGTGKSLSCTCPANFSVKGPIWGTDIYTDDSYICKAALHAGRIGRSGGQVSIRMIDGQSSYAGTLRNGVTSLSYRRHTGSYRFD
tara:strand:- start:1157 stop:2041 length:885 start_codon:yes stop_codon:yes gene_type:complete